MVIAKRDSDGHWHITDPPEYGCDWSSPEEDEPATETGTVAMIVSRVNGEVCDDCDW